MNPDQELVSWVAVFALVIGIFLVYKQQLSAILFGPGLAGGSTVLPTPGNKGGIAALQPTPAPPGQSGQFKVDQNGDLYKMVGGAWVPWGTTASPVPGTA